MIKLFILAWLFIHADGTPQMLTQAYSDLKECQKAGEELSKQSDELMKASLLKDYYGGCVPTEYNTKGST